MKAKHERAIARYESKLEEARSQLLAKVQPDLHQACRKWGLDYVTRPGRWMIEFNRRHCPYGREETRMLMRRLEPALTEVLDKGLDLASPIGSLLEPFQSAVSDHEWVILHTRSLGMGTVGMFIQRDLPLSIETGYVYFGWISEQLALFILRAYSDDVEVGRTLLRALPRCLTNESLIYPIERHEADNGGSDRAI